MTEYELWVKGCEINHSTIIRLEGKGDTGLYQVGEERMIQHREYSSWVYVVWVKGENVATLTGYLPAIKLYQSRTRGMDI